MLLGKKIMTNLDSILKSRDITLLTKVLLVKAMVFPVVLYGFESWAIKKAKCQKIDAFGLNRFCFGWGEELHHDLNKCRVLLFPGINRAVLLLPSRIQCGLPWWLRGKESTYQCRRSRFDPWIGKIP